MFPLSRPEAAPAAAAAENSFVRLRCKLSYFGTNLNRAVLGASLASELAIAECEHEERSLIGIHEKPGRTQKIVILIFTWLF